MTEYRIKFEFDYKDIEDESEEAYAEINYWDDNEFASEFDTDEGIKKFEEWYNVDNEQISIIGIYSEIDEKIGYFDVSLENELKNPENFANELLDYIFDGDVPTVSVNFTGTTYEMAWNGRASEPYERKVNFDYDKIFDLCDYKNVSISKTS